MAEIALKYLKSTLVPDVLSFFPKIFDWGSGMYLLKGIRVLHFAKEGNQAEDLIEWLKLQYGEQAHDKLRNYILVWFDIILYIHTACCIWIFIGRLPGGWYIKKVMLENPDHPDGKEELSEFALEQMDGSVYVNAWMDIVITVTQVGYGMRPVNHLEQTYLFSLMFVSFFVFAIANIHTAPFKFRSPLKQFLIKSQEDLESFINALSMRNKNKKVLAPKILDVTSRFVNMQICFSAKMAFRSKFYKAMPPYIKNKLVSNVLCL